MALIKCKECGTEVSQKAKTCPKCGAPVKKKTSTFTWIVTIIVGLVIIGSFGDKSQNPQIEAQDRQQGFHCLSKWDGSHSNFKEAVKEQLKDPSSFEHVITKVTPMSDKGAHTILMEYRAKNSFGAIVPGKAVGTYNNSDCNFNIVAID